MIVIGKKYRFLLSNEWKKMYLASTEGNYLSPYVKVSYYGQSTVHYNLVTHVQVPRSPCGDVGVSLISSDPPWVAYPPIDFVQEHIRAIYRRCDGTSLISMAFVDSIKPGLLWLGQNLHTISQVDE